MTERNSLDINNTGNAAMMLGILGVGHLATAMLKGWLCSGLDPRAVLLSPRGKSATLAASLGLRVAPSNQALVEQSDAILLAVRPDHVASAIADLPWREGQLLVSVCAGVSLQTLAVAPAHAVRAMPLTASEVRASPTAYFPAHAQAKALLDRLGPSVPLASEGDFEIATVSAAVYGWAQELIRLTANWSAQAGLDAATARRLVATTFVAAGRQIAEHPEPMEQLLHHLATPGGITELGLELLAKRDVPTAWEQACAAVLDRLTSRTLSSRVDAE